jgi:hypothetical protein
MKARRHEAEAARVNGVRMSRPNRVPVDVPVNLEDLLLNRPLLP